MSWAPCISRLGAKVPGQSARYLWRHIWSLGGMHGSLQVSGRYFMIQLLV